MNIFKIAKQIEESLYLYSANIGIIGVGTVPETPKQGGAPRAIRPSNFSSDGCGKLIAAEKLGIVTREFDAKTLWKFNIALYAAMSAKFAMSYYMHDMFLGSEWNLDNETDMRGTADVVLVDPDTWTRIPVEIKRTDADNSAGIYASQVWQTICYMEMLDTNYGIVLTLYNGMRNSYRAWTVTREADRWSVWTADMVRVDGSSVLPFFTREEYNRIRDEYILWDNKKNEVYGEDEGMNVRTAEFLSTPGPHSPFSKPCCTSMVPADYYKRKSAGGNKGELKKGTGIVSGLCPLYAHCHKDALQAKGIHSIGPAIEVIVDDNGTPNFKQSALSFGDIDL